MCYESLIATFEPRSVLIYEDGIAYINQCKEMCKKYNIPFSSILVGDGKIKWNWTTKRDNNA